MFSTHTLQHIYIFIFSNRTGDLCDAHRRVKRALGRLRIFSFSAWSRMAQMFSPSSARIAAAYLCNAHAMRSTLIYRTPGMFSPRARARSAISHMPFHNCECVCACVPVRHNMAATCASDAHAHTHSRDIKTQSSSQSQPASPSSPCGRVHSSVHKLCAACARMHSCAWVRMRVHSSKYAPKQRTPTTRS